MGYNPKTAAGLNGGGGSVGRAWALSRPVQEREDGGGGEEREREKRTPTEIGKSNIYIVASVGRLAQPVGRNIKG